jgi:hypothetical protein
MAKLNEKRKKEKEKKAMLVLMLYTSWLTCTHIIWKSKEPEVLTKGQGQGVGEGTGIFSGSY